MESDAQVARLSACQARSKKGICGGYDLAVNETQFLILFTNYSVCWLTFNRTPTLASITNRLDPP